MKKFTELMVIVYWSTCYNNPEDLTLQLYCYENLKSYRTRAIFVCSVTNFLDTDGGDILENSSEI